MTRPPWVVWGGIGVVLAAAAVLSFDALRGLAVAVAIPPHLGWLLPIAVDAGAAVSCATWLGGRTHQDAARFAGRMTWSLLAVTVAGNAGQLGMHAHQVVPPWWVAVLVGAIPPAVVGATVHLVVLLVRRPAAAVATAPPVVETPPPPATPAMVEIEENEAEQVQVETVEQRAARLIADGAGRKRLVDELAITEWKARQLLSTGGGGR